MIIRAALASSDGINVDRHFGAAEVFEIYEINTISHTYEKVDRRTTCKACHEHVHNSDRLEKAIRTIEDCNTVFAAAVGYGARAELIKYDIIPVETELSIWRITRGLAYGRMKLPSLYEIKEKNRKSTITGNARKNLKQLQNIHPCMGGDAHFKRGRIHLPVSPECNIQCKFCSRRMDKSVIRPGVTSLILTPEETPDIISKAKTLCPELSVVGIAGPGDTLASTKALETFALVKKHHPEMICCLSTNGFRLPDRIDRIAEIGVETITVTVNAVDPEIEAKINNFVIDENGVKHEGIEGAKLLIEHQLQGIKRAAELGIVVKINSVLIPGINNDHIPEVARVTSELGASLLNIIPLIPQNEMADIPAPSTELIQQVRTEAGKYLEIFMHCKHCRADSCGIPGQGQDLHGKLYDKEVAETFSHG